RELAAGDDLGQVAVRPEQPADGFPQVDDVDQVPLAVDVRPHLRVPPTGPVAVVDPGVEELLDVYDSHGDSFPAQRQIGQTVWFTRSVLRRPRERLRHGF